jgi:HAD superfamily hydrolase (TIGR01549 family)
MRFRGIIFDLDGTLTIPQIDFDHIRKELELPPGHDLIVQLAELPEARQRAAWALIESYEERLAENNVLQERAADTLTEFAARGIRLGLLTRNSPRSITIFREKFHLPLEIALGRDFKPVKPAPEPVWHIIDHWELQPAEVLFVGDYRHDLEAGAAAGTATCFFHNPGLESFAHMADYTVGSYAELARLVFDE